MKYIKYTVQISLQRSKTFCTHAIISIILDFFFYFRFLRIFLHFVNFISLFIYTFFVRRSKWFVVNIAWYKLFLTEISDCSLNLWFMIFRRILKVTFKNYVLSIVFEMFRWAEVILKIYNKSWDMRVCVGVCFFHIYVTFAKFSIDIFIFCTVWVII